MNIQEAKEWLETITEAFQYGDIESAITYNGYKDAEKAIETVLNELDKKDKEIKELKQDIKEIMGKDRDCLTFGYHSAYVGLIDDLIKLIEED